jgi:hypothetical protein
VRRANNLATFVCRLSRNLGALTSWNPQGLSWPVMGLRVEFAGTAADVAVGFLRTYGFHISASL